MDEIGEAEPTLDLWARTEKIEPFIFIPQGEIEPISSSATS
jgi:hypothetical protein